MKREMLEIEKRTMEYLQVTFSIFLGFDKIWTKLVPLMKISAKQSVCTPLDENAITHSVLLGSKNVRKGGGLNF